MAHGRPEAAGYEQVFERALGFLSTEPPDRLKPGRYRLKLHYGFKRIELEPRTVPNEDVRKLWTQSLEVELESDEVGFQVGPR